MTNIIRQNFEEAAEILNKFMADEKNIQAVERAGQILSEAVKKGNKAISCGNGGSMCDAMHFAEEMSGRFRENRGALPAVACSDPAHLSCVSNDYGYDFVFSRFVDAIGAKGDVLLAISTSGNSKNVLNAVESARKKGMRVIGLTGKDGGKMATLCDVEIRAPQSAYADRAQEIHIKVIHTLIQLVEANI
ncbi:MAG TPA: D-sedoheptulose 7-phosphate isomerase [bacterium]|nr:D-sedoheptulose 7-phosphate isomerase [bacterium]